jgi:PIN domain
VANGRGIVVVDLTERTARRAGALLARAGLGSAHAVDAFVVATALELGPAVIATGDPDDLGRLARGAATLRIFKI